MAKAKKKREAPRESEYSLSELVKGARAVFGVSPECVMTAFRLAGLDRATERQARKIVDDFMKQEV